MTQMIHTQNQRTPVSQVPGIGKKDAINLWSAYRFRTGDTPGQYNVFNVIQGAAGQGFATKLTARETSILATPGQVPLDQKWQCFDVGVDYIGGGTETDGEWASTVPVTAAQAADLNDKLQLAFLRGGTQLVQMGPVAGFPGGGGVYGGDTTTTDVAGNGFPSVGAKRALGRTLVLNPGDTWGMAFLVANADEQDLALGSNAFVDVRVSFWMYRDLGLSG